MIKEDAATGVSAVDELIDKARKIKEAVSKSDLSAIEAISYEKDLKKQMQSLSKELINKQLTNMQAVTEGSMTTADYVDAVHLLDDRVQQLDSMCLMTQGRDYFLGLKK